MNERKKESYVGDELIVLALSSLSVGETLARGFQITGKQICISILIVKSFRAPTFREDRLHSFTLAQRRKAISHRLLRYVMYFICYSTPKSFI